MNAAALPWLAILAALGCGLMAGTFFAFSGICAAGFVFVAMCVPETKGRSLEEVEALLS